MRRFILSLVELMGQLQLLPFHKDVHLHSLRHSNPHFLDCGTMAHHALELSHPGGQVLPRDQVLAERGGLLVGVAMAEVVQVVHVDRSQRLRLQRFQVPLL